MTAGEPVPTVESVCDQRRAGRPEARAWRLARAGAGAGRARTARGAILGAVLAAIALAGCSDSGSARLTPEAERGRQVYLAQCTACHASDPAQNGPLGPPVRGSSRELLEARILRGSYPPGYAPKRPSAVMQPMPNVASSIPDLAAFLR